MKAATNPQLLEDDDEDCGSDDLMNDVYVAEQIGLQGVSTSSSRTNELTLSFEGEVFVFPAVTPDKVRFLVFFSASGFG